MEIQLSLMLAATSERVVILNHSKICSAVETNTFWILHQVASVRVCSTTKVPDYMTAKISIGFCCAGETHSVRPSGPSENKQEYGGRDRTLLPS